MIRQWCFRGALLAIVALAFALPPLTPSQAAPPLALTASAEPPTRTPVAPTAPAPAPTAPAPAPTEVVNDEDHGPSIDLSLRKTATPDTAVAGAQVTFVLTVRCEGRGQANNVLISDTLPEGLTLVEAATSWGELTTSGRSVRISIPVLYAGDEVTVTIVARLEPGAQGTLLNRAAVSTDSEERDLANNGATAAVSVVQPVITPSPTTASALSATTPPEPASLPVTGRAGAEPALGPAMALLGAALVALGLAALGLRARG